MKKIIISDFDDTLYVDGKISDENRKSIHTFRQKGNLFVIATGSSYTSFKRKCSNTHLEYDYLIVNHGSTIYKNDAILSNEVIDKFVLDEIISRYNILENKSYVLKNYENGNFFSTAKEGLVSPDTKDITKIHLEFKKEEYLEEVKYLREKYNKKINLYEILNNNDIEIISNRASKMIAIDKILKLELIQNNNVYTIGDGFSDVEMIKKYNGYAVPNAVEVLKQYSIKEVEDVKTLVEDVL